MKKYFIFLLIFIVLCSIYSKSGSTITDYLNSGSPIDSEAKDFMPVLEDLPNYENIAYQYTHKSFYLFQSDSVALVVNYDEKTYQREKDKLAEKYIFLDSKTANEMKDIIPENEFTINSYTFKVVAEVVSKNEKGDTFFPKSFGMIGTSDEKSSIAYLYFYDFDLDGIGEEKDRHPMEDFVKTYFKYNF